VTAPQQHLDLYGPFDTGDPPERRLSEIKAVISTWQTHMIQHGGWNSITGESHDQPRSLIRFGSEEPEYRVQSAKALAVLWLSLSGTPYIYQGQELGMINVPWDWPIEEYKDLVSQRHYAR
jgi:alpha-glucosidase